jgi:NADH dehydrogenase
MASTIVRPSTYMETWAGIVGGPILASGKARVYGGGRNPINFVSVRDVAAIVERAVMDPESGGRVLEVRGPEDLTFDDVVERFAVALGRPVPIGHVPRPMLRLMAVTLRLVRPTLAEQIAAAVTMDTADLRGGPSDAVVGDAPATTFDSVIRTFVAQAQDQPAAAPAA